MISRVLLCCLLVLTTPAWAQEVRLAPMAPAFERWLRNPDTPLAPTPFTVAGRPVEVGSTPLPSRYDLREQGRCTPVRDQMYAGTCWIFGTYAALEGALLPAEPWDFAEKTLRNRSLYDLDPMNGGGNPVMATALLTGWMAPGAESDDPYDDTSLYSPPGIPVRKHVQEVLWPPDRSAPGDVDYLKRLVMQYGPVGTAVAMDLSYYNRKYHSLCVPYQSANHYVAIVGWDDAYPREWFTQPPAGDGAFLIKNSWSEYWGDHGYFWVSYYDKTVGTMNCCFPVPENTTNYARQYQYDPLGVTGWAGLVTEPEMSMAAVYTAEEDEWISAAGFYAATASTEYRVCVFLDPPADSPIGNLQRTAKGITSWPGYKTVVLSDLVKVHKGQRFAIVVDLKSPYSVYPLPVELRIPGFSSRASANPGETYIGSGDTDWFDCVEVFANASMCVRAFSIPDYPVAHVQGRMEMDRYTGDLRELHSTVLFRNAATGSVDYVMPLQQDVMGRFSLPWAPQGDWDLIVRTPNFLGVKLPVQIHGDVDGLLVSCLNGDADGDNQITLFDYLLLDHRFGAIGNPGDLDGDGMVTLFDYLIVDANVGATGE